MSIQTKDRYFGEGIGAAGEADPRAAFNQQRNFLRRKRLDDVIGADAKLMTIDISLKFEQIATAIEKADDQVFADNAEFCKQHGITR